MSDPEKEIEAELSREKLLDKIKILEDRLLQKEELIEILKEYNQKFIRQSEKLTSILEKQQQNGLNEREQFLLKKVEQVISKVPGLTMRRAQLAISNGRLQDIKSSALFQLLEIL